MFTITDIQKIAPWAAALPLLPKVLLTALIVGVAGFLILLIWLPDPKAIKPLKNARLLRPAEPREVEGFRVEAAYLDNKANGQRKFFDITLANYESSPQYLTQFQTRWRYQSGALKGIHKGELLEPTTDHSIVLEIDSQRAGEVIEKRIDIHPPLLLPGADGTNPSITTLRVELYYMFDKAGGLGLDYHPSEDWDIEYDVSVVNDRERSVKIFSGSWKKPESPISLPKPNSHASQFIPITQLKRKNENSELEVAIDTDRRLFRFRGGELVTIKVQGGVETHKLFIYGYLPLEVTDLKRIDRIGSSDRRVYAILRKDEYAQFLVPNSSMDFELQGVKIIPSDSNDIFGSGNVSIPIVQPLPNDVRGVEGVSLSGIEQGFNVLVTWEKK